MGASDDRCIGKIAVSAFGIAAAMLGLPAEAQSNERGAEADAIQEVVVTAQFRQQSLQDTPLAITAVSAAQLEARSQTRITDITAQAPNVLLQPNPSGQGNSMRAFIRGVGQSDQSPSVEPGVGIYVDDIYFGTITAAIFDLLDLERVEILRGPQGTLSGMNSVGGSVKLFSRQPTGEGAYLEGTLGDFDRRDVRGSADFAIVPERLFARLSGVSRHRDGYVTRLDYACSHPNDPFVVSGAIPRQTSRGDCKLGELGNQSLGALRGSLRWIASDRVEVNLTADWTHDTSETQANVLLRSGEFLPGASLAYQGIPYDNRFVPYGAFRGDTTINDPYVNYANYLDPGVTYTPANTAGAPGARNGPFQAHVKGDLDAWGVSNKVTVRISDDLDLESITGYRRYESLAGSDNDGSPVMMLLNEALFTHRQFSQEVRLNSELFDHHVHFTVGGIYFDQRTVYRERVDAAGLAGIYGTLTRPTFDFVQQDPMEMKNTSGFAHLDWDVSEKLALAGGIRVTHEDKDYSFYRLSVDGQTPFLILSDPANPLNGRTGNYAGTIVDYRANVSYKWTSDLMTYVQYATGFKGGGISPRPYFPQQIRGFGPEKLKSYEVGLKSSAFERLRFNTAVFYMDYTDYQATPQVCVDESGNPLPLPYGTPGLCGQYLNVADATVKGIEAEVQAEPIHGLLFDASYSYLDFEFGRPKIATTEVVAGASRPGIGDRKWSAGIQYEIPFFGGGTMTPRVDVFYTPGYCGNLACTPIARNEPYTLANARLTYRNAERDWSVALEVTNLSDKLYYLNKFVSSYANGQPGRPREWAVTVRKSFQ